MPIQDVNLGKGFQGAGAASASGAATGAIIGSIVPGVGTAIGGAVGGAIGAVGGFISSAWSHKGAGNRNDGTKWIPIDAYFKGGRHYGKNPQWEETNPNWYKIYTEGLSKEMSGLTVQQVWDSLMQLTGAEIKSIVDSGFEHQRFYPEVVKVANQKQQQALNIGSAVNNGIAFSINSNSQTQQPKNITLPVQTVTPITSKKNIGFAVAALGLIGAIIWFFKSKKR